MKRAFLHGIKPFSPLALNLLLVLALVGCHSNSKKLAPEIVILNWAGYLPQAVMDRFTKEYGVKIDYQTYTSVQDAVAQIRSGKRFDVVVIELDLVPVLASEGLLAKVNYENVPNFKNISPSFRDLGTDPGNLYSIPYNYGTTGLLVRQDLVSSPVTRWADLWDPQYAGKVAARPLPGELIGITLKSMGYPLNSEDPHQLNAALLKLIALRLKLVDDETHNALPSLLNGDVVIMVGWAQDALEAQATNPNVTYILPEEGTLLWGDCFVFPSNSTRKYTAEVFVNFLLRPDIGAQIVDELHYATTNVAAYPLVSPEIINNQIVFPPEEVIQAADWYTALTPAGEKAYAELWEKFMNQQP